MLGDKSEQECSERFNVFCGQQRPFCVCKRERERARQIDRQKEKVRETLNSLYLICLVINLSRNALSDSMSSAANKDHSVCVRERERESEREGERERH